MKLNHRHYTLIIFAFATMTISVLGYIFIYSQTRAQAENYLSATKEVALANSKNQYEQKLVQTYEMYKEDRAKIETYIVKEDGLVPFIERIEKIGPDTGTDLELSSIVAADGKIKAKVLVEGTWTRVMSAMMLMENLPMSIVISNVRLDSSGDLETTVNKKVTATRKWKLTLEIEALTIK